jgi:hypothetical protein
LVKYIKIKIKQISTNPWLFKRIDSRPTSQPSDFGVKMAVGHFQTKIPSKQFKV